MVRAETTGVRGRRTGASGASGAAGRHGGDADGRHGEEIGPGDHGDPYGDAPGAGNVPPTPQRRNGRMQQPTTHDAMDGGDSDMGDAGDADGDAAGVFGAETTFRILVATDSHLGFMEKDPVRGNDSFEAFEEMLQIARDREVDMILLGGDLFHDNKPSIQTLHNTITLLRHYCMGDRPCEIEILSDQSENFPNRFATVNYMDPNLNIGIPVFSIHGNHDDPSGGGNLCSLEILSAAGLVNYFGKQSSLDEIHIKPVLLRKGTSHLALYGLGNVRDERLNRLFRDGKVRMFRPRDEGEPWFNLMVLHQNRVAHSRNNYIPEAYLADFLHLVFWGHEHQCMIDPELNDAKAFYVTQPGSSVATALCEGEAETKHVGILSVQGTVFALEKVRLRSVRPFVIGEIMLSKATELYPKDQAAVCEYIIAKVTEMIETAKRQWHETHSDKPLDNFPKPLIRLKVEYSGGFTTFNPQQFGNHFVDNVANPKDILTFYRTRSVSRVKNAGQTTVVPAVPVLPEALDMVKVEDLVDQYLDAQKLEMFPENEFGDAVKNNVDKNDKDALRGMFDKTMNETKRAIGEKIEPVCETQGVNARSGTGGWRGGASTGTSAAAASSRAAGNAAGSLPRAQDTSLSASLGHVDAPINLDDVDQLTEEISRVKVALSTKYMNTQHDTHEEPPVVVTKKKRDGAQNARSVGTVHADDRSDNDQDYDDGNGGEEDDFYEDVEERLERVHASLAASGVLARTLAGTVSRRGTTSRGRGARSQAATRTTTRARKTKYADDNDDDDGFDVEDEPGDLFDDDRDNGYGVNDMLQDDEIGDEDAWNNRDMAAASSKTTKRRVATSTTESRRGRGRSTAAAPKTTKTTERAVRTTRSRAAPTAATLRTTAAGSGSTAAISSYFRQDAARNDDHDGSFADDIQDDAENTADMAGASSGSMLAPVNTQGRSRKRELPTSLLHQYSLKSHRLN